MILNAVCMRATRLTATTLRTLFGCLPSSPTSNRFKVCLCKLCLVGTSSSNTRRAKPRPQAKVAPRPHPARQRLDAATERPAAAEHTEPKQETIGRTLPSPPCSEIFELLSGSCKALSQNIVCQLKFQLTFSFAELQELLEPGARDQTWLEVMRNGELSKEIDRAFADDPDSTTVEQLKTILSGSCR